MRDRKIVAGNCHGSLSLSCVADMRLSVPIGVSSVSEPWKTPASAGRRCRDRRILAAVLGCRLLATEER